MHVRVVKLVTLLVIAATLLSLAGSVTAQDASYVRTFDLPTKPTTEGAYAGVDPTGAKVVYWHPHQGAREQATKNAVDKFNKENPWKITIEPIFKGNYDVIFQAMLAALQTKELPNLTVAYGNQAAQYQNVNALVDLNAFVNDQVYGLGKSVTDDFFPVFIKADVSPQHGNQRLGMSLYRSMEVLYYNKDALTELGYSAPPKTWDEFKDMACKYTKSGSGRIGYEVRTDGSFVAAAAFAQGGDIYDYTANKFIYDSPEAQVAPQVMQELYQEGCASLIAEAFSDQADFAKQKSLFYIGTSSGLTFVRAAINDSVKAGGKDFVFDIAPIPYKDKPVVNVYGAPVSVPKTTKEQELAAWLFIRWYTEPEQQADWAITTNYFPVRQSTAKGLEEYFKTNIPYKSAFDLLAETQSEPAVAGYDAVRSLASKAFNNVLDGKPVDEEFASLNEQANEILAKNKPGSPLPTPIPTKVPTAAATAAN
jgi:multiple sugar transport system substrate-binding protein